MSISLSFLSPNQLHRINEKDNGSICAGLNLRCAYKRLSDTNCSESESRQLLYLVPSESGQGSQRTCAGTKGIGGPVTVLADPIRNRLDKQD